jgi:ribosomal protein S12 methylthiotransferase
MKNPKIHVLNLGCSKNQVDSENILGELVHAGYSQVESQEDSDVMVINTCGFIESAKEESIDEIMQALAIRKPGQKLVVAGCLSQRYKSELQLEIPEVDLFMGTYEAGALLKALDPVRASQVECQTGSLVQRQLMGEENHHAFLKIAEGCNRTCSFCAIPGMRGKQKSRTLEDIIRESQTLQSQGIKEISLVAQDLTYFGREKGGPGTNLKALLEALIRETDLPWIRLMYAYPAFLDDSLIELMATESRICKYLDMPIQHASDRMLKLMRRGHTGSSLRKLLRKLRSGIPDLAMRTTLLIGHPGETEEDFEDLRELVEEIRFERMGCFTYSDEEGTHAAELDEERVDVEVAMERAEILMDIQRKISLDRNESLIGQTLPVLIDRVAEGSEYHYEARTQWDAPEVDNRVLIHTGDAEVGSFRQVRITDATEYDLEAELI